MPEIKETAKQSPEIMRFHDLCGIWDEAAARNGGKPFALRFKKEIQALDRYRRDFPHKSIVLPLRLLELRMFLAFRNEFPAPELLRSSSRLRGIAENSSFP